MELLVFLIDLLSFRIRNVQILLSNVLRMKSPQPRESRSIHVSNVGRWSLAEYQRIQGAGSSIFEQGLILVDLVNDDVEV